MKNALRDSFARGIATGINVAFAITYGLIEHHWWKAAAFLIGGCVWVGLEVFAQRSLKAQREM